jgi:hypothetical protein
MTEPLPSTTLANHAKARLRKQEDQDARAELMMIRRLTGHRIEEIAAEFGISPATVHKSLSRARQRDMIRHAQAFVVEGLVPEMLHTYHKALTQDEDMKVALQAARDVGQSTGVLVNRASLEVVRERIFARLASKATTQGSPEGTLDGADPAGDAILDAETAEEDGETALLHPIPRKPGTEAG